MNAIAPHVQGELVKLQLFHPRTGVRVILAGQISAVRADGDFEVQLADTAEARDFRPLITVSAHDLNHTPPPAPTFKL